MRSRLLLNPKKRSRSPMLPQVLCWSGNSDRIGAIANIKPQLYLSAIARTSLIERVAQDNLE